MILDLDLLSILTLGEPVRRIKLYIDKAHSYTSKSVTKETYMSIFNRFFGKKNNPTVDSDINKIGIVV